jgi:thiol-disulfide isomerase/thioredoxin
MRFNINPTSSLDEYSRWIETITRNKNISGWLIANRLSDLLLGKISFDSATFSKQLSLIRNPSLKNELTNRFHSASDILNQKYAPDILFINEKGVKDSLSNYQGKYIYLSFWSSYCVPCISEITTIYNNNPVIEKYKLGGEVKFIYISLDRSRHEWLTSVKKYNPKGYNAWVEDGIENDYLKTYNISLLPRHIIINPDGSIGVLNASLSDLP